MRWPAGGAPAGVATVAAASSDTTGMLVPHRGQKYAPEPTLVPQRVQKVRPATVIETIPPRNWRPARSCSNIALGDGEATGAIAGMRLSGLSRTPPSAAGPPRAPPAPSPARRPPPRPAPP